MRKYKITKKESKKRKKEKKGNILTQKRRNQQSYVEINNVNEKILNERESQQQK